MSKAVTRRKNASTVLGFMDWIGGLRDSDECRKQFEAVLKDPSHKHWDSAYKLMLAYSEGTPIKRVAAVVVSPQQQETGQQVSERVWQGILQLAQTNPTDPRVKLLASIQGAESKLANAEPAEVV